MASIIMEYNSPLGGKTCIEIEKDLLLKRATEKVDLYNENRSEEDYKKGFLFYIQI